MDKISEQDYIKLCCRLMEEKMKSGSYIEWKNKIFEKLSEEIFLKTKVNISVSTLKRLFGRSQYIYSPNFNTLDTISQFLGYKDWISFKTNFPNTNTLIDNKLNPQIIKSKRIYPVFSLNLLKKTGLIVLLSSFILIISLLIINYYNKPDLNSVIFETTTPEGNLPFLAKIHYDVSKIKDSIYLKIGNRSKVVLLNKNNNFISHLYELPGIQKAKLIYKEKEIDSLQFIIYTQNWLSIIRKKNQSIHYLNKEKISNSGYMYLQPDSLDFNIKNDFDKLFYYNVNKNFSKIKSNHFILKLSLCFKPFNVNDLGRKIFIDMQFEKGFIEIPFFNSKNTVNSRIYLGEKIVSGKNFDISNLIVNDDNWHNIILKVIDNKTTIYIDNKNLFNDVFSNDLGNLIGLKIFSLDNFAVDNIELYDQNSTLVYSERFD